jgi:hypothetical protein
MPKLPTEITDKAREIYDLACTSNTPLNVLSLHGTILLASQEWQPEDVEQVSGAVMELLIKHGWKRQ